MQFLVYWRCCYFWTNLFRGNLWDKVLKKWTTGNPRSKTGYCYTSMVKNTKYIIFKQENLGNNANNDHESYYNNSKEISLAKNRLHIEKVYWKWMYFIININVFWAYGCKLFRDHCIWSTPSHGKDQFVIIFVFMMFR